MSSYPSQPSQPSQPSTKFRYKMLDGSPGVGCPNSALRCDVVVDVISPTILPSLCTGVVADGVFVATAQSVGEVGGSGGDR